MVDAATVDAAVTATMDTATSTTMAVAVEAAVMAGVAKAATPLPPGNTARKWLCINLPAAGS